MPIKLTYFDLTARAELARLILHYSEIPFEDIRIEFSDWPALKPKTPMGHLPVLEFEGKEYSESWAISRFLAREYGLYGKTNLEGMKIDICAGIFDDMTRKFEACKKPEDEKTKLEMYKKVKEEDTPKSLGVFEQMLKENGTGFVVGDSVTMGDLIIFDSCTARKLAYQEALDTGKFPLVKKLVDDLASNDKLKPYLDKYAANRAKLPPGFPKV